MISPRGIHANRGRPPELDAIGQTGEYGRRNPYEDFATGENCDRQEACPTELFPNLAVS